MRTLSLTRLVHPHYTHVYKGRFYDVEGERRFEEEHTGIVVATRPSKETSRDPVNMTLGLRSS